MQGLKEAVALSGGVPDWTVLVHTAKTAQREEIQRNVFMLLLAFCCSVCRIGEVIGVSLASLSFQKPSVTFHELWKDFLIMAPKDKPHESASFYCRGVEVVAAAS